ncbi:MAG: hypothetical protein KKB45_07010 [Gammaproteobacteria bacterium]|nr:hypothetical protein [Gammaproteobacteria bacterium]
MHLLKFHFAITRYCSSLLLLLFLPAAVAKSITIVASPWIGLTNADGSGLYFQIFREAMATQDIQLNFRLSNWKRAKHMFYAKRADVLLGDYYHDDPSGVYPRWHLDFDQSVQLFSLQPLQNLTQLQNRPVGWLLGYDFDKFLPVPVEPYEVATEEEGFMLLQHQRLAAFISYQNHQPDPQVLPLYSVEILSAQALYPLFQNDFQGRQLARAFDLGMAKLYQSGRLAQLHADQKNYQHARYELVK